MKFIGPDQ